MGSGKTRSRRMTEPSPGPSVHLFVIAPNNSGSTLLRESIIASTGCWSLSREGQHAAAFAGPSTRGTGTRLIWAASASRLAQFSGRAYDWPRIRASWHAEARALNPASPLFITSSPPFLLHVAALRRAFSPARFLFLVRNPYAVVESILRRADQQALEPGEEIVSAAATHALRCLQLQRHNLGLFASDGLALRYEDICADPPRAADRLRAFMPELDGFEWQPGLLVKGVATIGQVDRNAEQIARLPADQRAVIDGVFSRDPETLSAFGYFPAGS